MVVSWQEKQETRFDKTQPTYLEVGDLDKIPRKNGFAEWTNTRILGTRTETRWKIFYLIKENY